MNQQSPSQPHSIDKRPFLAVDITLVIAAIALAFAGEGPLNALQFFWCSALVIFGSAVMVLPYALDYRANLANRDFEQEQKNWELSQAMRLAVGSLEAAVNDIKKEGERFTEAVEEKGSSDSGLDEQLGDLKERLSHFDNIEASFSQLRNGLEQVDKTLKEMRESGAVSEDAPESEKLDEVLTELRAIRAVLAETEEIEATPRAASPRSHPSLMSKAFSATQQGGQSSAIGRLISGDRGNPDEVEADEDTDEADPEETDELAELDALDEQVDEDLEILDGAEDESEEDTPEPDEVPDENEPDDESGNSQAAPESAAENKSIPATSADHSHKPNRKFGMTALAEETEPEIEDLPVEEEEAAQLGEITLDEGLPQDDFAEEVIPDEGEEPTQPEESEAEEPEPSDELDTEEDEQTEPEEEDSSPQEEPLRPRSRKSDKKDETPVEQAGLDLTSDDGEPLMLRAAAKSGKRKVKSGETALLVRALIGIGNKPFIRGEGGGLSPDKGLPLEFVEIGRWRWTPEEPLEETLKVSLLLNDKAPAEGGAILIEPGQITEVSPRFTSA